MYPSNPRPKWWQLYLTVPLLVGLFLLDSRLKISERGHQAVQIGIILVVYGLIQLWLKANAIALSKMDQRQYRGRVTVTRVPLSELDRKEGKRPMFQLPKSEIQGLLGDIFEMDTINAESLPIDEISEELKEE
jgi:hypothetical protein